MNEILQAGLWIGAIALLILYIARRRKRKMLP